MAKEVRIQKFISEAGVCSRRAAEKLILQGEVKLNGKVVSQLGTKLDPEVDTVTVSGRRIIGDDKVLYIFHKPRGIVTTVSDPQGRQCVGDFIDDLPSRVYPVGRLDTDVSGLLLLTNDGEFTNTLLHPRYRIPRVYWALVRGRVDPAIISLLTTGVELSDGKGAFREVSYLKPSQQTRRLIGDLIPEHTLLRLVADEGRKHFVKKMLRQVGHRVFKLSRVEFGPYKLGTLKEGGIRRVAIERSLKGD